jgi:hypothetical protein
MLGPAFLIFDFWGPTYFLKQQKYLEKIVKKLAGVRLEAWAPAPRVWVAAPPATLPHRRLLPTRFFYILLLEKSIYAFVRFNSIVGTF